MYRSMKRGDRYGTIGIVSGLLAVAFLGVTLLTLLVVQDQKLEEECQQRRAYDASSQRSREVFRSYYLQQPQDARTRMIVTALDDTLGRSVQADCGGLIPWV